jgi:hypothetical protein
MLKRRIIVLLVFPLIAVAANQFPAQKNLSPIGCFSDLREINQGIIGTGVIKIWLVKGRYNGSFAELSNELGLAFDETRIKNISFDKKRQLIRFDVTFNRRTPKTVKGLTGKVSRSGIKMNWGNVRGMYGPLNPFMKRGNRDCN